MSSYELRFRIIYLVMWILLCPMSMSLFLEELKEFQSRGSTERNTGLQSSVRYEPNGDVFEFTVNGIPDHDTGYFPSMKEFQRTISIPAVPSRVPSPVCLSEGMIGIAKNGVPIYNPYTSKCCDSGVEERSSLDVCWGNVDENGQYHYQTPPLCTFQNLCNESQFVGVALDGFPIYTPYDESGYLITSDMLDQCHGIELRNGYRYIATTEFPYMLNCFKGSLLTPSLCSCTNQAQPCPTDNSMAPPGNNATIVNQPITNFTCCAAATNCGYIRNSGNFLAPHCIFRTAIVFFATIIAFLF